MASKIVPFDTYGLEADEAQFRNLLIAKQTQLY